jgi:hypothetical protein
MDQALDRVGAFGWSQCLQLVLVRLSAARARRALRPHLGTSAAHPSRSWAAPPSRLADVRRVGRCCLPDLRVDLLLTGPSEGWLRPVRQARRPGLQGRSGAQASRRLLAAARCLEVGPPVRRLPARGSKRRAAARPHGRPHGPRAATTRPPNHPTTQDTHTRTTTTLSRRGWSLVSEFDLACSGRWLLPCCEALFFVGALLGCAAAQASSKRGNGEQERRRPPAQLARRGRCCPSRVRRR